MESYKIWLIAGAVLSGVAGLLHLAIIFGGAPWYRFFGAGERMARAAEAGQWYPTVVTLGIAGVLLAWAAYALAGAGVIALLPLLKPALVAITAVYLLRGILFVPALMLKTGAATPFALWSSLICLGFGLVHLLGVAQGWQRL
jgi:hypothetical protein